MNAPVKLLTIGDSTAQGFRSLSAARTDQCFSTIIAGVLGDQAYRFPLWKDSGLPVDLEVLLRQLVKHYGSDIKGFEWVTLLGRINEVLDDSEDYYERGAGQAHLPDETAPPRWSNLGFFGAKVADAWQVTPSLCLEGIARAQGRSRDGFLGSPSAPFYRSALRMLNPTLNPEHQDKSQLDWVAQSARNGGIENLIVCLGANNCLGTMIDLEVRDTPDDPARPPHRLDHFQREAARWNLWSPKDFEADYRELVRRLVDAIGDNSGRRCRVFVATVPLMTIAPVATGVGKTSVIDDQIYYELYTYFPFDEEFARSTGKCLTQAQALHIDETIRTFNATIVAEAQAHDFHVVDLATVLSKMAWKRNGGHPPYQFPRFFEDQPGPPVNTLYYHADRQGRRQRGGVFSLDGIHATAIGQGLMAWEFLKVMEAVGVPDADPDRVPWADIFREDSLFASPISLMQELYEHQKLAELILRLMKWFGR